MPIKKKKISELTLADSMVGLYTIGVKMVNGVQTSVKVSLEFIKMCIRDSAIHVINDHDAMYIMKTDGQAWEEGEDTEKTDEE